MLVSSINVGDEPRVWSRNINIQWVLTRLSFRAEPLEISNPIGFRHFLCLFCTLLPGMDSPLLPFNYQSFVSRSSICRSITLSHSLCKSQWPTMEKKKIHTLSMFRFPPGDTEVVPRRSLLPLPAPIERRASSSSMTLRSQGQPDPVEELPSKGNVQSRKSALTIQIPPVSGIGTSNMSSSQPPLQNPYLRNLHCTFPMKLGRPFHPKCVCYAVCAFLLKFSM